jgi:Flp pilus assembly protein TadD
MFARPLLAIGFVLVSSAASFCPPSMRWETTRRLIASWTAHQLNPQDQDMMRLLLKAATLLGQKTYAKKQYASCLRYLKKAAALQPADADVHRRLAELYTWLGQAAQAEFESREAERLSRP